MARDAKPHPEQSSAAKADPEVSDEKAVFYNPQTALGTYTNLAIVRHTQEEFQIDFLQQDPAGAHQLATRIWTSPAHFKRLAKALIANLAKYEEKFGEVPERQRSPDE